MFHWRKWLSHEEKNHPQSVEKSNLPRGTVHEELRKLMVRRPY